MHGTLNILHFKKLSLITYLSLELEVLDQKGFSYINWYSSLTSELEICSFAAIT